MEKKTLRKKILAERDAQSKAEREAKDKQIWNRLFNTEEYQKSTTIFVFISFKSEVFTHAAIEKMLKDGKRVCVPVIPRKNDPMEARYIEQISDLKMGLYNIMEPPASAEKANQKEIDLIIAPGAVFTRKGKRIGYGGGYYDRFLSKFNGDIIAICYDLQIVDDFRIDEWDVKIQKIITENELIAC
ncbi:5-formyltetrahydrofolate cyclo-ligase [Salibacter halophilus]|uniref:5-formyltetrahydrofolate cyclo-ligase n=1 Tax=Salibacter halophilus TaxID=1803916 RepID=UPI0014793827|nr:5-formyltetrahydrofolate cyclo-ligase [Salibacter halophilus]